MRYPVLTLYSDKVPLRFAPKAFDVMVERAVAAIPARFRARMRNLLIVVQPVGPSPGLLGLYEGCPMTERSLGDAAPDGPDRIRIFQRPHEDMARNPVHLERIVTEYRVARNRPLLRSERTGDTCRRGPPGTPPPAAPRRSPAHKLEE